jgi:cellular nucleic acid-binding protein
VEIVTEAVRNALQTARIDNPAPPRSSSPRACFHCRGDHLVRDCPSKPRLPESPIRRPTSTCYTCGAPGHYSSNCPKRSPRSPRSEN